MFPAQNDAQQSPAHWLKAQQITNFLPGVRTGPAQGGLIGHCKTHVRRIYKPWAPFQGEGKMIQTAQLS